MNADGARWVAWETRPDGGNMFRLTKAHVLVDGHRTLCGTDIPRGGLVEDPRPRHEPGMRVSYATERDIEGADRCRRCIHQLGPDPVPVRQRVANVTDTIEEHALAAAYLVDGDPAHLYGSRLIRVRNNALRP